MIIRIVVLAAVIVSLIFFFPERLSKHYSLGRSLNKDAHTEEDEEMDKKDRLYIEELRYIGQKDAQSGNEGFNIFYMYILVIAIIGAAVSQLVYDHFQAKGANDPIIPLAIDALASVLLLAGFVFSWICFDSYFRVAKSQIDWFLRREKMKIKYDSSYKEELRREEELRRNSKNVVTPNNDCSQLVPPYIRLTTALSSSLCLGGVACIVTATIAFWLAIQPLILKQWVYQSIITILATLIGIVGGVLFSKLSWKSSSKILKISFEEPLVVIRRCIVSAVILGGLFLLLSPYLHAVGQGNDFTKNPQPASQIYVAAACLGIFVGELCLLAFKIYTCKSIKDLKKSRDGIYTLIESVKVEIP